MRPIRPSPMTALEVAGLLLLCTTTASAQESWTFRNITEDLRSYFGLSSEDQIYTQALDINNAYSRTPGLLQAVGRYDSLDCSGCAFLYNYNFQTNEVSGSLVRPPSGYRQLDLLSLNDSGTAVGFTSVPTEFGVSNFKAVLWDGRSLSYLPLPSDVPDIPGTQSTAADINNRGRVVGYAIAPGIVDGQKIVRWEGMTPLSLASATIANHPFAGPAGFSKTLAINDDGHIVGAPTPHNEGVSIAGNGDTVVGLDYEVGSNRLLLLLRNAKGGLGPGPQPIGADLGEANVYVSVGGNNNSRWVVGNVDSDRGAFLWRPGTGSVLLNSLNPDLPQLIYSTGINERGDIAANGFYSAFLISPGEGVSPGNPVLPELGDGRNWMMLPGGASGSGRRYYDPPFAVGYVYEASNELLFSEIEIPYDYGDGEFDLYLPDEDGVLVDTGVRILSNEVFSLVDRFGHGVRKFALYGIETEAQVDPNDPEGFVTGLSFIGEGTSFTMTPVIEAVPEPETWATLVLGGVILLGTSMRRKGARAVVE